MTAPDRCDVLRARRLGVDTYREPVVFLRSDSPVCRAEGFRAMSRVQLGAGGRSVVATLNVVLDGIVDRCEAGLSEAAWLALGVADGGLVEISHPEPVESFSAVRSKIYGCRFDPAALHDIVRDVAAGRYSSIELAAFVTACAGKDMSMEETLALTRAMVDTGTRLSWNQPIVLDKHCVGGLPGNRTTPIVVAIAAACGLTIPKTSSRAITSPAGTADTMEMLAPVSLTLEHMRRVVEREGGCVVWGGAMALSPVDDILIQIERPLNFDSEAQLAASVMSKKLAAGATHLLIDLPVGPTAKVRSSGDADALASRLQQLGEAVGISVRAVQTDGLQPVGRGIGPALEAADLLDVLQGKPRAPEDLRKRALLLAGTLLEMGGRAPSGKGESLAAQVLHSGDAWRKFQAICEAQGGMRVPPVAAHRCEITADRAGRVSAIDNRRLANLAKLAGAPLAPAAGLRLDVRNGYPVERGTPLFCLHAQSTGELEYAVTYARLHPDIIQIEECP